MPTIPLNRSNAWEFWKTGRVAATNVDDLGVDSKPSLSILANLAIKDGYNAIRLWLNWGSNNFNLMTEDWRRIGWEGWGSSTITKRSIVLASEFPGTYQQMPISAVAAQITSILNKCQSLGLGVILTGNFFSEPETGFRLWHDAPAGPDAYGYPHDATTAEGLQGDLGFFWQKTVLYFGNHPALIGIDLLNEPTPTAGLSLADARSSRKDTWPQLAKYLTAVIRRVDPSAAPGSTLPRIPIIIEGIMDVGVGLNVFLNPTNSSDTSYLVRDYTYGSGNTPNASISDDRIIYSSHAYLPGWIAQQGVDKDTYFGLGATYPLNTLARDWINVNGSMTAVKRDFRTAAGWDAMFSAEIALKNLGLPVFMGEFGAVQPRLEQVYPPATDRASRDQRVSTVPGISSTTNISTLIGPQQITSIDIDTVNQRYTFGLGNIGSDSFQPSLALDAAQVGAWSLGTINSNGDPVDGNGKVLAPNEWPPQFFANRNLTATVYLVSGGKPVFPPIVNNAPITIIGGTPWFSVNSTKVASGVAAITSGTIGGDGKYPVVAVVALGMTTSTASIEASRTSMLTDMLRMCQRNKFSWSYYSDGLDSGGFVGFRASPDGRAVLTKAANGDTV